MGKHNLLYASDHGAGSLRIGSEHRQTAPEMWDATEWLTGFSLSGRSQPSEQVVTPLTLNFGPPDLLTQPRDLAAGQPITTARNEIPADPSQ